MAKPDLFDLYYKQNYSLKYKTNFIDLFGCSLFFFTENLH